GFTNRPLHILVFVFVQFSMSFAVRSDNFYILAWFGFFVKPFLKFFQTFFAFVLVVRDDKK
ncbi:hypothetical protein, partial [Facklamia sp. 7083-14-GEN3]|uniref:hypothetical protein n=1 Tax=Facklamia sp. 7083-14-GEN3 TaxID=2973478 RepID=UPI00215C8B94